MMTKLALFLLHVILTVRLLLLGCSCSSKLQNWLLLLFEILTDWTPYNNLRCRDVTEFWSLLC